MNGTLKKVWNICSGILVSGIVILAILLAGIRVTGITPYVVLSGSMEPVYPVGSMIYVRQAEPEAVKVGEAITFYLDEGMIATHRVVEIDEAEQHFVTKGDANETMDAPVSFGNLIGKPVFCIPGLGRLSAWIAQPPGMYVAGCFALVVLVLMFLPEILDKADAADKKEERERLAQQKEG